MSIESVREIALVVGFVVFVAVLLGALTPRGLHGFEDAVRLPVGKKGWFVSGGEGR